MTPAQIQAAQSAALDATRAMLPHGTRMFINGQVIVIALSGPDLKPGVPDAPSNTDINAAIKQLQALKVAAENARGKTQ